MMLRVVRLETGVPAPLDGRQACIRIGPDGRFRVISADESGAQTEVVASDTAYADGEWVRVSLSFDYTGAVPQFTLRLNGAYCGVYRCLGARRKVSGLDVTTAMIDDVLFTDGEPGFEVAASVSAAPSTVPAGVTVSQTWLDRHGLAWGDTESDADGDGFNVWQEYLAGTSPTDGSSVFAISDFAVAGSVVSVTFTGDLPRPDLLKLRWCERLGGPQREVAGEVRTEGGVSVWRATVPAEARFFRAYLGE